MENQKNLYYIYKKNKNFAEKAEQYIKYINNNITIPALIIEQNISNDLNFNLDDLKNFYSAFGEVLNIIIKGRINIVLFRYFLEANICKVFLEQKENYKINFGNNFLVRWFDINRDINLLNKELSEIFVNISNNNLLQMKFINNNINNSNNDINIGVKMDNTYMNNMNNNINIFSVNTNNINNINNIPDFNIISKFQNQNNPNNINNIIMNNYINNLNNAFNISIWE